jgi:hypothetical protein
MSARLSVFFHIVLCLEVGAFLLVLPWWPQGMWPFNDWGNNYFLLYAARKTGLYGLQAVVASGWVRGAVSGIGLLNLGIAFSEIINFKRTVAALQNQTSPGKRSEDDAAPTSTSNHLPNNERQDDASNNH